MIIIENFNLLNYNSYKINAVCSKAYFPESEEELVSIMSETNFSNKIFLGNGNNTILSKKFYEEEFIILNGCLNSIEVSNTEIAAGAGATLLELSKVALENSLSGLEIFYDIPSSVGGAVVMNAGTKEGETKDVLSKVRYLDLLDNKIYEMNKVDINFEYRNSFFQKNKDKIVLKAWFKLDIGNFNEIELKMNQIKKRRWERQPREYPNCGSVFKRPSGKFVGPMLDELGLKGYMVGGAMVSKKHSGFIVNYNNASGKDILDLIKIIQEKVRERFDIKLEVEQRII